MSKVTVIIPSYNHARFLQKRLASIYNQTYKDWEAVIIDDCSNDDSILIIQEFLNKHPDFKVKNLIVNEINSGSGYQSWKKGIEIADSEYVWIAETDDYSDVNFLQKGVDLLDENPEVVLFFCATNYVNETGEFLYNTDKRLGFLNVSENNFGLFRGETYIDKMPFNTLITNANSVIFRKPIDAIPDILFDYKQSSDIFLWTYLLQNRKFIFLNDKLNYFRRHQNSTTFKIEKYNRKSIYFEKAQFINYFNLKDKIIEFIKHYINNYVWLSKKDFYSLKPIQIIKTKKNLKLIYLYFLLRKTFCEIIK